VKGRLATTLVVAAGSGAGALFLRRRSARNREHVDLYFADGSMVSFADDSPEAARLLPLARQVLSEAR
jgi:hypothetical protein